MPVDLTLPSLRKAYAAGETPDAIIEQVYARIAEVNDPAIFISLREKANVLEEVTALGSFDPDKPLWGVPFAVKDNIDVVGLTTGLVGVRSPYGFPRNAVDADIVPGGSSAGSGVSVAHGIVSFALGTDTAGSGRVPAALNNIVGLKPTLGSWSARGSVPACRSVETISVFALTVEDAHAVFRVGSTYDPGDAFAKDIAAPALSAPLTSPKIAVPSQDSLRFYGDDVQAVSFNASLEVLKSSGAEVVEIDFQPFYDVAEMLYEGAWVAERYTVIEDLLKVQPEAVHPVTTKIITAAERLSAADAFRGIYRLKELERVAEASLEGIDMLCVPSIPTFYSCQDLELDPVTPNSRFGTYTNFVNLAMLAATATLLEDAGERTLGATGWARPARVTQEAAQVGTPIVVCGAHMSGLPLNKDLTRLGAVLDRKTTTDTSYRFYALAGGPPKRPGLVRSDGGAAIDVEVWLLPTQNVGAFLATIPSPLGLGRVMLADGASEIGFLCEAAGLKGAEEITHLGSWRSYLAEVAPVG